MAIHVEAGSLIAIQPLVAARDQASQKSLLPDRCNGAPAATFLSRARSSTICGMEKHSSGINGSERSAWGCTALCSAGRTLPAAAH